MDDEMLLDALLDLDLDTLGCVLQMAKENRGTLAERLGKGYYEMTNGDDDPDKPVGLR